MRWSRFSLRSLLITVALVALVLGGYIQMIELQKRVRRFRRADSLVSAHVELMQKAAEIERTHAQEARQRAFKDRRDLEQEQAEADQAPTSLERAQHQAVVRLWDKQVNLATAQAKRAERRASAFQAQADALAARQRESRHSLNALEQMPRQAEDWLALPDYEESLPPELIPARTIARIELRARSRGRSRFPTSFGKRTSAIEATAICQAEQFHKKVRPGVPLAGFTVKTSPLSRDRPLQWVVTFIDPKTGREYHVRTFFGEAGVDEYLAGLP